MGSRGRLSTVAQMTPKVVSVKRPDAPKELSAEQKVEWDAIVGRLPPDWFPRESHPTLMQYCRLIIRARRVAKQIDEMEEDKDSWSANGYRQLVRNETSISRMIVSLGSRLRLHPINQRAKDYDKKKPPVFESNPWDDEKDDE